MACKAMFEQIDATFQKGMGEHTNANQQHFENTHAQLALNLRVCIHLLHSGFDRLIVLLFTERRKYFEFGFFLVLLQEALNAVSSVTQTMSCELVDGQRKLIALAASGANASGGNQLVSQRSNGLNEKVCSFYSNFSYALQCLQHALSLVTKKKKGGGSARSNGGAFETGVGAQVRGGFHGSSPEKRRGLSLLALLSGKLNNKCDDDD